MRFTIEIETELLAELWALAVCNERPVDVELDLAIREWLALTDSSRLETEFVEAVRGQ